MSTVAAPGTTTGSGGSVRLTATGTRPLTATTTWVPACFLIRDSVSECMFTNMYCVQRQAWPDFYRGW